MQKWMKNVKCKDGQHEQRSILFFFTASNLQPAPGEVKCILPKAWQHCYCFPSSVTPLGCSADHQGSSLMLHLAVKVKASVKSDCRSGVVRSYLEGLACKSNHREILLQEPGDRNPVHVEDEGCPEPRARMSSWLCPRSVGSPKVSHLGLLPQL